MKKIAILFLLILSVGVSAQNIGKNPLKLTNFEESRSESGMKNLGTLFRTNWPKDHKTGRDCAWIRLKYENMTETDLNNLVFKGLDVIEREYTESNRNEQTLTLFVAPVDEGEAYFEVRHSSVGTSNRIYGFTLKPKSIYYITLVREMSTNIIVDVQPSDVFGFLDSEKRTDAFGNIPNVSLGRHILELVQGGRTIKVDTINVTEDNIRFEYDARKKRLISFVSDPSDCDLYLDDQLVGRTPMSIELPYDSYHVEAKTDGKKDIKDFTVDATSKTTIELEPIRRKRMSFSAVYDGKKVDAGLSVNGKREPEIKSVYTLDLAEGERYNITMDYRRSSVSHDIKIRKKMNPNRVFTISAKNDFLWPWERLFDDATWGFTAGYVSKQWTSRGGGHIYRGNAAWGAYEQCSSENKRLRGVQLGWRYNPTYEFGLGLHTGLFAEIYKSSTDADVYQNGYNSSFSELSLYMPVHVLYRFPLSKHNAFYLHGGLGFDFGLLASYSNSDAWASNDYDAYYGENGFPDRFNMSGEIGFGMRFKRIMLDVQYSKGLTNHKDTRFCYFDENNVEKTKTKQNKISFGLSYMYGGDYNNTNWIWEQLDETCPLGLSIAYVNKRWVARSGNSSYKGNAVWGQFAGENVKDKYLHGVQLGIDYNPLWKNGFGLYSGLFFELYFSSADDGVKFDDYVPTCDSFYSIDMYVPLHLGLWLPLGDESCIQLHGGLGFDIGCYAEFYNAFDSKNSSESVGHTDYYGSEGFPDALNTSLELALDARWKHFSIFTQISRGITNHESVIFSDFETTEEVEVSQNKFTLGISYNF